MLTAAVEKRLYTRICSEVPLVLCYGNVLLARCNTINLGVGGLLVGVKDTGLVENSLIRVEFDVPESHSLFKIRIPAIVLRREKKGIALSFENLEKGTEELINECFLKNRTEIY